MYLLLQITIIKSYKPNTTIHRKMTNNNNKKRDSGTGVFL